MHAAATVTDPQVLITDYAWSDVGLERQLLGQAGLSLACGPSAPGSAAQIEALVEQHQPAAILTCWAPVSARAVAASARLRMVGRLGVGLDNIAVEEATRRGVWVTNVPDYCTQEVADHAVGLLLALLRGLVHFDRAVHAGRWEPASARLRRLSSLTCGVVGYGRSGRRTAQLLSAFGARVLVHTRHPPAGEPGREFLPLEALLGRCDALLLHLPLNAESHHLLDARRLALLRPGALIVNVSRGAVLDTAALIAALGSGHVAGAALDVLEEEPCVPPELLAHPNVILTPHVAFSSDASLAELRRKAAEEVIRVLGGARPLQPCNQPAGRA
ncbi:MAG: C-terminal binding protein [Gammaproteobacteria bacterium]|nr:C-terminal binding protein [Gammaproteobacteria bacterium]